MLNEPDNFYDSFEQQYDYDHGHNHNNCQTYYKKFNVSCNEKNVKVDIEVDESNGLRIWGNVCYRYGRPVCGAMVLLYKYSSNCSDDLIYISKTQCDNRGYYCFILPNGSKGKYLIKVIVCNEKHRENHHGHCFDEFDDCSRAHNFNYAPDYEHEHFYEHEHEHNYCESYHCKQGNRYMSGEKYSDKKNYRSNVYYY